MNRSDFSDTDPAVPRAMPAEQVFPGKPGLVRKGVLILVPGLILVVGSFAMAIIVALRVPSTPDRTIEPGLNSGFYALIGPPIFGLFIVFYGLFLLRQTRRVVLNRDGVHVHGLCSCTLVPWCDIDAVDRSKLNAIAVPASVPSIELLNAAGKRLEVVTDSVFGFEALADALIAGSSATTGRATFVPEAAEERRVEKGAKAIRLAAWAFVVFFLLTATIFALGVNEELHTRRYATEGVKVEADILRTWMVRVTPYVEYEFKDAEGNTISREAMMFQGKDWDRAQESKTITVEYLPSSPQWNRIVHGENSGALFGGKFLFLSGFGILLFGFLGGLAIMGYDLDAEPGKVKVLRHGRVIKEWGVNAKKA
ncbi:MAG TPA: DUF3592 domain-containing protein [Phycisphaerae bacterium]|nr:DUF3592 domain-containing protein [Phycisphaerae bacterium]